jgi:raffinose/stachyose/melibiose transport system substrate-binding protein
MTIGAWLLAAAPVAVGVSIGGEAGASGDRTEVNYWTWSHITQVPGTEGDPVEEAFEAANPDVDLVVRTFQFPDYQTALRTSMTGDSGPAVVALQNGSMTRGLHEFLDPVGPLLDDRLGDGWEDEFNPNAMALTRRMSDYPAAEALWGLPVQVNVLGVQWYWQNTFAESGIEVPETYDEFVAAAATLRDAGVIPVAWGAMDQWPNTDWLVILASQWRAGAVEAAELGEISFTDESIVNALTFMQRMMDDGLFNEGPFGTTTYPEANGFFIDGSAATYNTGLHTKFAADTTEGAFENWRAFLFPHISEAPIDDWLGDLPAASPAAGGPGPSRPLFDVSVILGLRSDLDDETADAALRFIEFMGSAEGQGVNATFMAPTRRDVQLAGITDPGFQEMVDWHFAVGEFGERRELLFPETREALQGAIENVLVNGSDPESELAKVDEAAAAAREAAG